jgi:hypothetical protein
MQSRLGTVWRWWLKFAVILGNIQMVILLSILYWTLVALVAIPFKIFADPLALRTSHKTGWLQRRQPVDFDSWIRKQG